MLDDSAAFDAAGELYAEDASPKKSAGSRGGRDLLIERAIRHGARDAASADHAIEMLIGLRLLESRYHGREGVEFTELGLQQYLKAQFPNLRADVRRDMKRRNSGPHQIILEIAAALGVPAYYVLREVRSVDGLDR